MALHFTGCYRNHRGIDKNCGCDDRARLHSIAAKIFARSVGRVALTGNDCNFMFKRVVPWTAAWLCKQSGPHHKFSETTRVPHSRMYLIQGYLGHKDSIPVCSGCRTRKIQGELGHLIRKKKAMRIASLRESHYTLTCNINKQCRVFTHGPLWT